MPAICKKERLFRALQSLPLETQCRGCPGIIAPPLLVDRLVGLGDLNASGGSKCLLDVAWSLGVSNGVKDGVGGRGSDLP